MSAPSRELQTCQIVNSQQNNGKAPLEVPRPTPPKPQQYVNSSHLQYPCGAKFLS